MAEDKNVNKKGFWKGMKSELKKVIWPTGGQTVRSTLATIFFVLLVSLVLIVFNLLFNSLSKLWINALSHEDVIEQVNISDKATETSSEETANEVAPEEALPQEEQTSGNEEIELEEVEELEVPETETSESEEVEQ